VLQEKVFERVGGVQSIRVDVRVIAATHQHLEQFIAQARFREDLFYRLNVISLWCPPLRERADDLFELAVWFLRVYAERTGKHIERIDEDALDALARYDWPGNIRQLENVIERAVVLAEGTTIGRGDLPPEVLAGAGPLSGETRRRSIAARRAEVAVGIAVGPNDALEDERSRHERDRLSQVLADCGGNKSQAARRLGIPRSTLFSKLARLGLE
jgi:DNA-binding NtrC family response regulator